MSAFSGLTPLRGLHVPIRATLVGVVFARARAGQSPARRDTSVMTVGRCWHSVDAVWLVIVATVSLGTAVTPTERAARIAAMTVAWNATTTANPTIAVSRESRRAFHPTGARLRLRGRLAYSPSEFRRLPPSGRGDRPRHARPAAFPRDSVTGIRL